jgi:hypothetical protein
VTRPRQVPQDFINEAMQNLDRTNVIAVGVSDYDELENLEGPSWDMEMVSEIFMQNDDISLFDEDVVTELENPTSTQFRNAIAEYVEKRSARGDILILYFTGHGCILPSGSFGFCLKDAKVGVDDAGIFPITAVPLDEVVSTFAIADVHPVFILDACFSSANSPQSASVAPSNIEDTLRRSNADTYALLASSSSYSVSMDTPEGGAFTQALYQILTSGFSDDEGRRYPVITLAQLAAPLQEELSRMGVPLSRCYVGRDFPILPIVKNANFEPQSESFAPYMRKIVELLWQDGKPREAELSEFSTKIGQGAYANHSKLSLAPWALLEDAGTNKVRRLTSKGKKFAAGEISIPKNIERDPFSGNWRRASDSQLVRINEI